MNPAENTPPLPEENITPSFPDIPPATPPKPAFRKYIIPLIALIVFLPTAVFAVLNRQSLFSSAKRPVCVPVTRININPGVISTYLAAPPTEISALAYSADAQSISGQVTYQWGISSSNSVGDLKPRQEIALFIPQNPGTGNIWVSAKNACTKKLVQVSIPVSVTSKPLPTPTPVPTATPSPTLQPTPTVIPEPLLKKRVFITSTNYSGNLGGLNGADAKCQLHASNASLSGTFKAWLSSDTVSAASRLNHTDAVYVRIDKAVIATGWADLTDGSLDKPLNVSEIGTLVNSSWVWTNSTSNGSIRQAQNNSCLNWLSDSDGGGTGDSTRIDSGWADYGASACYYPRPLYCFEQ